MSTSPFFRYACTSCLGYFDEKKSPDDAGAGADSHKDNVNSPKHYTEHPSGVECIQVAEHLNFCLGNAVKYLWRADLKGGIEDLRKARWYIDREIKRRQK